MKAWDWIEEYMKYIRMREKCDDIVIKDAGEMKDHSEQKDNTGERDGAVSEPLKSCGKEDGEQISDKMESRETKCKEGDFEQAASYVQKKEDISDSSESSEGDHSVLSTSHEPKPKGDHSVLSASHELKPEGDTSATPTTNESETEEVGLPPLQMREPFYGMEHHSLCYWGFSQQGESHIRKDTPCQDSCRAVFTKGKYELLIATVADGVGSCPLSHYGSFAATEAATSYLKEKIESFTEDEMPDAWIGQSLREAMDFALQSVRRLADEMEQMEYLFQSTLDIAIYDREGRNLFIAHSGDGGVVALSEHAAGMVTSRIKGEDICSVYPLQAGASSWQVLKVNNVNGFIMATDGVLDAFVRADSENNRVYYPFIQPAFETEQAEEEAVRDVMKFYYDYMASPEYRQSVTDDITILAVSNQACITKDNVPVFDQQKWTEDTEKYEALRQSDRNAQQEKKPDLQKCEEHRDKGQLKVISVTHRDPQQVSYYEISSGRRNDGKFSQVGYFRYYKRHKGDE